MSERVSRSEVQLTIQLAAIFFVAMLAWELIWPTSSDPLVHRLVRDAVVAVLFGLLMRPAVRGLRAYAGRRRSAGLDR